MDTFSHYPEAVFVYVKRTHLRLETRILTLNIDLSVLAKIQQDSENYLQSKHRSVFLLNMVVD